jgi:hypothetical protein
MSVIQSIGLSVVSSILAVAFVFFVRVMWQKWLEDYWLRVVNRNVPDLRGQWEASYTDNSGNDCSEGITVEQFGWRIRGKIQYRMVPVKTDTETRKVLHFEGFIRNDLFVANYWNCDRRQKGAGSFTLALRSSGDKLIGQASWFDVEADEIVCGEYSWKRSGQ